MSDFIAGLRPDVVINGIGPSGKGLSVSEALALRDWFDARRKQIVSSGGRPTNPNWSIKRQIPMSVRTWETLKRFADDLSSQEPKVSPAQVASIILEASLADIGTAGSIIAWFSDKHERDDSLEDPSLSVRFREWRMPAVFGVASPLDEAA